MRCCCGAPDCAFLKHNTTVLDGVERDLAEAARMGQALLVRHETYVADSERDRGQMGAIIEALEKEKQELEQRNSETIQANRELLDKLEHLNVTVAESDAQIQSLTETLHSTEQELARLSSLATRTQSLERQLIDLEREQLMLHAALETKVADERTAMQRWRRAEKTIEDLHEQLNRIEADARRERGRHGEIVARMERRMAVDGALATAAGRTKARSVEERGADSVVSHFVNDIMADNAKMQHGILELRELLQRSNDEVEQLREQLHMHQPVSSPSQELVPAPVALDRELQPEPFTNKELHIHHHYHAPPKVKKESFKPQIQRRPRRKRYSVTPSQTSSTATILSQTSVTVPPTVPPNTQRWSNATTLAATSIPGSPFSMSIRDSIYDRVFSDVAYDSSRPTSPSDSVNIISPNLEPTQHQKEPQSLPNTFRHQTRKSQSLKPPSLATIRSASSPSPVSLTAKSSPAVAVVASTSPPDSLTDMFLLSPIIDSTIAEEEEGTSTPHAQSLNAPPSTSDLLSLEEPPLPELRTIPPSRHGLRRAASHESLISVSGMDIHTLQSRPSQLLYSTSPHFASSTPGTSPQPVLTPWTATATASLSRSQMDSSAFNRSLLYGSGGVKPKASVAGTEDKKSRASAGLGKKVGGWVLGKWGAAPTPTSTSTSTPSTHRLDHSRSSSQVDGPAEPSNDSNSTTRNQSSPDGATATSAGSAPSSIAPKRTESKTAAEMRVIKYRAPGINQSGPIWGFFDIPPTPSQVEVKDLDAEALDEALGELREGGGS